MRLALLLVLAALPAAAQAPEPAKRRGAAELAFGRAVSEGYAAGRAVSCQALSPAQATRLGTLVTEAAVRARATDNALRVTRNFEGGLDGGLRTTQGPGDDQCPSYARDLAAIAARYGMVVR